MDSTGSRYNRRSIRLKDYDYSQEGAYFITLCTNNRLCLFGEVIDEQMYLSKFGEIVAEEWARSALIRKEVALDGFVVMPNHVHGVVVITGAEERASRRSPLRDERGRAPQTRPSAVTPSVGATGLSPSNISGRGIALNTPSRASRRLPVSVSGVAPRSIGAFVAGFKTAVTKRINEIRASPGIPVWQRNYYEHIVRNEEDLNEKREYIRDNPVRWAMDEENPETAYRRGDRRVTHQRIR